MVGLSRWRKAGIITLFLAPSLVALLGFSIGPMIGTAWISLQKWNLIKSPEYIGLGNFRELLHDERFHRALWNTLYYLVGYLPLVIVGGLALALMVNHRFRGVALFRAMYFLPVVTSWVVVSLLWKWLLNPNDGLINLLLAKVGIEGPGWWTDKRWSMPSVILASAWKDLGFVMVILLAGLQAIPQSVLEAAQIDGARRFRLLRSVIVPLLTPSLFFVVVISLINGFQVFDQVWVMTNKGGPGDSSTVVVAEIVRNTFDYGRAGYGAAQSIVLFGIILLITAGQLRLQKRWVFYG